MASASDQTASKNGDKGETRPARKPRARAANGNAGGNKRPGNAGGQGNRQKSGRSRKNRRDDDDNIGNRLTPAQRREQARLEAEIDDDIGNRALAWDDEPFEHEDDNFGNREGMNVNNRFPSDSNLIGMEDPYAVGNLAFGNTRSKRGARAAQNRRKAQHGRRKSARNQGGRPVGHKGGNRNKQRHRNQNAQGNQQGGNRQKQNRRRKNTSRGEGGSPGGGETAGT